MLRFYVFSSYDDAWSKLVNRVRNIMCMRKSDMRDSMQIKNLKKKSLAARNAQFNKMNNGNVRRVFDQRFAFQS